MIKLDRVDEIGNDSWRIMKDGRHVADLKMLREGRPNVSDQKIHFWMISKDGKYAINVNMSPYNDSKVEYYISGLIDGYNLGLDESKCLSFLNGD